ncbi:hypothetical protein NG774_08560 [Aliarcobacter cryaerophilus]|uniref:TIR domain-containing protein n=1 Tax=Aliarcobacter cryaerophilus TaxID=28198 RepID=UPI003DA2965D
MRFNKSLKTPLSNIKSVLPINYSQNDILNLFKELYSYEWNIIEERYKLYKSKDDFLKKVGKKARYKPTQPKYYLFELQKVKHMLSQEQQILHKNNFNEEHRLKRLIQLREKSKLRISRINEKVNLAKKHIQDIEPIYLDIFIQSYHKKGITTEEKMEIVKELQKYDSERVLTFFYKLNDSERNNQIRRMSFMHLQSIGRYVKLRKGFKGKQKSYMTDRTKFDMKPIDLLERIENDSIQNKKKFDYFISHSFEDNELVLQIKNQMNSLNLHVYCDWLSDTDFLKRTYASEYTKMVLKKRIEQSDKVLFLRSKNTNDQENNFFSEWVEMEILYAKELNKDIECIDLIQDGKCEFKLFEKEIILEGN